PFSSNSISFSHKCLWIIQIEIFYLQINNTIILLFIILKIYIYIYIYIYNTCLFLLFIRYLYIFFKIYFS
ncbi:MAG: hypothetical protein N7Q72_04390, partial [Spiroplasma sp. Tabriz.8]|nr:hypothetical protein [Spiroplasma sp. Tabriz.8]